MGPGHGLTPGARPWTPHWPYCQLDVRPWTSCCCFSVLTFFICKMGGITISSSEALQNRDVEGREASAQTSQ